VRCPRSIKVAGAEAVQKPRMGLYKLTDVKPSTMHGNRPVYKNEQGQYLFFWKADHTWNIGDDYSSDSVAVYSHDDLVAACPTDVKMWEVVAGDKWSSAYTVTVTRIL
jgi:hypothetical protein